MDRNRVSGAKAMTAAAFMIILGIVTFGQSDLGNLVYEAELPLIIGDVSDPFQYDGQHVRELNGIASLDVDPVLNEGTLIAELETTEASGPIVISATQQLEGTIRVVMDEFYGVELFKDGGIAEELLLHGATGIMTAVMPEMSAEVVGWGLLDIYLDGELLYEDLEGYFMVTDLVRRRFDASFEIRRSTDDVIYSPDLEDKTGFTAATDQELHIWASGFREGDVALHLNLLIEQEIVGFGGEAPPPPEEPPTEEPPAEEPPAEEPPAEEPPAEEPPAEEPPAEENPNKGPKGNNGIGNGLDPQPPGNPPPNDEEGNTHGGGKKN